MEKVKMLGAVVGDIIGLIPYEKGIGRAKFVLVFALSVLIIMSHAYDARHYSFLENFMFIIIIVILLGNIIGLLLTISLDIYYIGALILHNIYDFETYPTYDSPYGIYPGYCNLLEGIDQCLPLTAFVVIYLGGSILRCRNMGVKWWWSLIPLYNPFVLLIKKHKVGRILFL